MEKRKSKQTEDESLDEALDESFPASDPVSVGHSDHVGSPDSIYRTLADRPKRRGHKPKVE